MKSIIRLVLLSLVFVSPVRPPVPPGSTVFGVFVATSPCIAVSRSALQIPATANCEMTKWKLTLFHDANTLAPTMYKLEYVYGLPVPGTNGLLRGGTKVEREGRWKIVTGTKANPNAIVYKLDLGIPKGSVSFLKVDDNLLHLLDRDESLAIGTAGWSYTLSRTGRFGRNMQRASPAAMSALRPASPTTSASTRANDSSILRRFVGRSPCQDVARVLSKAVNADCMKVKWDLTLYHDPNTLTPTTYKLNGTFYRERIREGKWRMVRGPKTTAFGLVYELDPDKPQGSLFFQKADNNILFFLDKEGNLLVGNADFSYTLNRARQALKN